MIKYEYVKDVTTTEYFKGEEFASDMFDKKYTIEGKDETPADVFQDIATKLSKYESADNEMKYREKWFDLMYNGWFRPGGSVMAGIRTEDNVSLINCTTLPLKEDTLEDIFKLNYEIAKCAAFRQGIGFDLSNLRPRKSFVGNAARYSTGTIPWMDMLSRVGDYVGQEGRKPALLVSLKISHPDIFEFLSAKDELGNIENANISVQITDDFMKAVEDDEEWVMSFEVESNKGNHTITKTENARVLFRLIAEHAYKTAEPGVQFIDQMRSGSMVHAASLSTGNKDMTIISTNACSEKPLPGYGGCNLLSSNMEKFNTIPSEYERQLQEIVPYMVRLSDNVTTFELENERWALPEQRDMMAQTREIGIGITNVHGWLMKQDLAYDSDEAIEAVENFMKVYSFYVFEASRMLGVEKGNAPLWDEVKDKEDMMKSEYFKNIVNDTYGGDVNNVKSMRNMAHMSIAPTGSLSNTFPDVCVSSGIEPVIGSYYWRRTRAIDSGTYTHYFVMPSRIREYVMAKMDTGSEDYDTFIDFTGSVKDDDGKKGLELIEIIDKYLPKGFFKPAHDLDYMQKIKMMTGIYNWVDAAVSCTYNLPNTATVDDIEKIYMEAYKAGIRAVSVYVDGSREGILIFEDPITNAKRYMKDRDSLCDDTHRPENISFICSPKRPKELPCNIHHTTVKGVKWLVLVGMLDDMPYELFAGEAEDLTVPKSVRHGMIIKRKKGTYSLQYATKRSEVEVSNIAHVLMNSEERAMTRLISLSLRHGVPHEFIIKQLKKSADNITDFTTVTARVLNEYAKYVYSKDEECEKCGSPMIRNANCLECSNEKCRSSKCG